MEHRQGEGLALGVRAEVRLKAKRVNGRDEGLDGVKRRAGDGRVLSHVASGDTAANGIKQITHSCTI